MNVRPYLLGDGVLDDENVAGDGVDDLAGGRLGVEDGDVLVQHRPQVRQPHLRRLTLPRVHPARHLCSKQAHGAMRVMRARTTNILRICLLCTDAHPDKVISSVALRRRAHRSRTRRV